MRMSGLVALMVLATGCATTRVVNLDTGQGAPIVYTPLESAPIEIKEDEFKQAVTQLVLDMKLNAGLEEPQQDRRLSLLASRWGRMNGA